MKFRYKSITELEIVQAFFHKVSDYSYFHFQNSSYAEEKLKDVKASKQDSILSLITRLRVDTGV